MKKTIIALLALSGVAFGATAADVNDNLKKAITDYGYTVESGFSLTTTVSLPGGSNKYFTFSDDWFLFTQENQYFGVTTSADPGSWNLTGGSATTDPFEDALVVGQSVSWLTGPTPSTSVTISLGCMPLAFGDYVTVQTSLSIITNNGTQLVNSQLKDAEGGYTAYFDLNEVEFLTEVSEAKITIGASDAIDLINYVAPETDAVPEPTTATLSLLALAGLAARRRRK